MLTEKMLFRALIVGLLIAAAEVLQGILRVRLLNRHLGDRRARRVGVVTGCGFIFIITWFFLPWVDANSTEARLAVGFLWLGMMLGLDLWFGRFVFQFTWSRIASDFDLRRGNWLVIGMLFLLGAPSLVALIRALIQPAGH